MEGSSPGGNSQLIDSEPAESFVANMVSIVIPTYNRAEFLKECIDSALAQDYPLFEVIVVDDGSTDDTPRICKEYGDEIRYFSKPNGGPASAINFGISKMRGEWLKPLGSDDILESHALSTFIDWAARTKSRILVCGRFDINSNGQVIGTFCPATWDDPVRYVRALWSHRAGSREILFGGALGGNGFVQKAILLEVGNLDEGLFAAEDWEWQLRAALMHGFVETEIPLPLYRCRIHEGQITRSEQARNGKWVERARTTFRRKMDAQVLTVTTLQNSPAYAKETCRLRRIYLPVLPMVRLTEFLERVHLSRAALFWAKWVSWLIAPSVLDSLYWAAYPPVSP